MHYSMYSSHQVRAKCDWEIDRNGTREHRVKDNGNYCISLVSFQFKVTPTLFQRIAVRLELAPLISSLFSLHTCTARDGEEIDLYDSNHNPRMVTSRILKNKFQG